MRMRKKKHGTERISACADLLLTQPDEGCKIKTDVFSDNTLPLCLEIGCGKGNFAVGMAKKYPDKNFIAMEKVSDVCCIALEKAKADTERKQDNLRFLIGDATHLTEWFEAHSIDTVYLNFSDPWPKKGYAKRRLTHRNFLAIYQNLLKETGLLCFKTDNEGLFRFSMEEFQAMNLKTEFYTEDLHHSEKNEDNIMTEYEKNFSEKGQVIYSAWVRF